MEGYENNGDFLDENVRRKVYQSKHEEEKQATKSIDEQMADAEVRIKRYEGIQKEQQITR